MGTTAADRRPSRRGFLALGGALAVGAAAGGGAWWWSQERAAARGGGGTTAKGGARESRNIDPLWTYTFDSALTDELGAAVPWAIGGMIVVPTGGGTQGFSSASGARKWGDSEGSGWQMLVAGGRLYRLSTGEETDGGIGSAVTLQTVDPKNGKKIKTLVRFAGTNDELRTHQLLCLTDRVAYVVVGKGKYDGGGGFSAGETSVLGAADIETGKLLWSKQLPVRFELSTSLHFLAARVVGSRLVTLQQVKDGTVHVVVRDVSTGAVGWERPYDIDDPDILRGGIAADSDHLYLGGSRLWALRLSDGAVAWKTSTEHAYGPPVLKAGILYAVGDGAGLTALDARSGKALWTERGGEVGEASTAWPPVLGTRYAYYKNGSLLRAISLSDHTTSLTYQTSGKQFYADADSKLVLGVDSQNLLAYPLQ